MSSKIIISLYLFIIFCTIPGKGQQEKTNDTPVSIMNGNVYSKDQLEILLKTPPCLAGYRTNQTGYLSRLDSTEFGTLDTTFIIENIKVPSENLMINGWLYLPLGNGKHPLIILTNGGGNNERGIKSLSNWLAPILAHCGIAAFVHDKRGTGKSEGVFSKTTYDDYAKDAGNCAIFLSNHLRIDASKIGVIGGSEGGRIAVLAASRFKEISFVVSFAGTVVSSIDDRINAQKGWLQGLNLQDTVFNAVLNIHEKSIRAWASNNPLDYEKVNGEIFEMRKTYERSLLPFTKEEMESIPDFAAILPTWYSLQNDYLSELEHFNKKWLAIFGSLDKVVPTRASVNNIIHYMSISGNNDYRIAIIPDCGHSPVSVQTKRMIRLDNMILNWMNENILN
jgi:uncharacterized protein